MSLIACPECKKQISQYAFSCPNCGFQIPQEKALSFHDDLGNSFEKISKHRKEQDYQKRLNEASNGLMKVGCGLTALPILVILLFFFLIMLFEIIGV